MENFIEDFKLVTQSKEMKDESKKFLENVIKAAMGDAFAAKDALKFISSSPFFIREALFWEKFTQYLNGVFSEKDNIRKLSEVFAENEEKSEYARRIIKVIDDLDSIAKVKYVINLTRALLMEHIEKPEYYRLCNVLRNTFEEDLQYLNQNIKKENLKDDIHIRFLQQNGLAEQTVITNKGNNEFEFTPLAHMLDIYGLDYGNEEKYKYRSDSPDKLSNYHMKKSTSQTEWEKCEW